MSTLALDPNPHDPFRLGRFIQRTPGFSREAATTDERAVIADEHFSQSEFATSPRDKFNNDIERILLDCQCEDWDGNGAVAVSIQALAHALRFYFRELDDSAPLPEVTPEPDGEVAIEWYGLDGSSFSISFNDEGNISYASVMKDGSTHGSGSARTADTKIIRRHIQNVLQAKADKGRRGNCKVRF